MTVDIRPVPVPRSLNTPEAAEFEACAALGFRLERASWGHEHFAESAAELFARHRNDAHRGHAWIGAWEGATIVGRAGLGWERDPEASTVELTMGVLPSHRRRGIGSSILAAAEEAARELGRSTVVAYSDHPDTAGTDGGVALGEVPVLRAPDGSAVLPASAPAARFAAAHGYSLAQLERVSMLTVSGRTDEFRRELESRTGRGGADGYRLELWTDRTPGELVDAYAAAREHMVLDVPAGGVTIDAERWDAARVRERESESLDGGTSLLVAAAVAPDGAVAGYTELELPAGREIAYQYDTLVDRPPPGPRPRHAREAREPRAARRDRPRALRRLHVERRRERPHARDQHRARLPPVRSRGGLAAHRRPRSACGALTRHPEPLASRTSVRGPVHERLAHDGRATTQARQAGTAVGVERVREVAGCAIHIHVLRVEARAAFGERVIEHLAHRPESSRARRREIEEAGCSPCSRAAQSDSSA